MKFQKKDSLNALNPVLQLSGRGPGRPCGDSWRRPRGVCWGWRPPVWRKCATFQVGIGDTAWLMGCSPLPLPGLTRRWRRGCSPSTEKLYTQKVPHFRKPLDVRYSIWKFWVIYVLVSLVFHVFSISHCKNIFLAVWAFSSIFFVGFHIVWHRYTSEYADFTF